MQDWDSENNNTYPDDKLCKVLERKRWKRMIFAFSASHFPSTRAQQQKIIQNRSLPAEKSAKNGKEDKKKGNRHGTICIGGGQHYEGSINTINQSTHYSSSFFTSHSPQARCGDLISTFASLIWSGRTVERRRRWLRWRERRDTDTHSSLCNATTTSGHVLNYSYLRSLVCKNDCCRRTKNDIPATAFPL